MIDRITVDKILDAANIVDVVSDFVTLKRAGANLKGLCPFHDDHTPSFIVSPARNTCKCWNYFDIERRAHHKKHTDKSADNCSPLVFIRLFLQKKR